MSSFWKEILRGIWEEEERDPCEVVVEGRNPDDHGFMGEGCEF